MSVFQSAVVDVCIADSLKLNFSMPLHHHASWVTRIDGKSSSPFFSLLAGFSENVCFLKANNSQY